MKRYDLFVLYYNHYYHIESIGKKRKEKRLIIECEKNTKQKKGKKYIRILINTSNNK